jgi:hypothetical protein
MSNTSDNPLERLYADKDEIERRLLVDQLEGYVRIDRDSFEVLYQRPFFGLPLRERIVRALLAEQAAADLQNDTGQNPGIWTNEFLDLLNVDKTRLKRNCKQLPFVHDKMNAAGQVKYYIPDDEIQEAVMYL